MFLKSILFTCSFLLAFFCCTAQGPVRKENVISRNTIIFKVSSENLRSTHSNFFNGASGIISFNPSPKSGIGIGVEYAHAPFHADNNWNLYNLKFIPVFLSETIMISQKRNFNFYGALREGLSFIHYLKEEFPETAPGKIKKVNEKGLYGYAALGTSFHICPHLGLHTEIGIKAYHLSTYDLEVNPHGLNFMGGVSYQF